ncbi:MAG: aminoacetone oxidase family FAD-binding enzyme [Rickettsiales bacterium]|nr:aminoacetone oxidase family FAD-binding enzyme [Rickettsiales bacterium]OUV79150.1 MAG: aminoacetone oxidase family FAD-binding enzyme [Rickettsiales bacterium TMED131]
MIDKYDVIIIGAGAAGLMSAIECGKRKRKVLLIDHADKIGEKIRISGGGRCNFTNINASPSKYISNNPSFIISALKQYDQFDFINLVKKYQIRYHEKKLGQLFCDKSAQQIIDMLLNECKLANVTLIKATKVSEVKYINNNYVLYESTKKYICSSLIISTGGLSIPKIGASKFGYEIAKKFNINTIDPVPALVPLTFSEKILEQCKALSGISLDTIVAFENTCFQEGMLFTHRGLSGPSILQISSYWKLGGTININLEPKRDVFEYLLKQRKVNPKQDIILIITRILAKRLAVFICNNNNVNGNVGELSNKDLLILSKSINNWDINPTGTEGYRTAEVTLGGIDTNELSSKTMMSKKQPGLYFIGEVVDVTGHLGGYNFQWAWSSGYVAGQYA